MIQRILVGLDGSLLAEAVLPYVTALAKRDSAEVTLLAVAHIPEEIGSSEHKMTVEQVFQRVESQAREYLHKVADRLAGEGVTVRQAVTAGDPATEIAAYAEKQRMDLIALATHGRSGLQRWIYGSVAEKVVHTTRTPLLLIRPREGKQVVALSRILVPLDGSPLAEAALAVAEPLAASFKAPLALLRAVELAPIVSDAPGEPALIQELVDDAYEAATAFLEHRAGALRRKGLEVSTSVKTGAPASAILEDVEEHPGTLVVMATHGRTGLAGALIGSVARRVVQRAGSPILLVPPKAVGS